ncbi:MAG: diaminopimelate epimerase [Phycisphaerae bacterium]|nr:diaminopimelate epimerase [Phycisphaerae bacterium]
MRFVKMHGIGNDYVYINAFEERVADPAALARKVADRHTGVGSDGLILVAPPSSGVSADVRMRMFNADGSESEMCGNGIRCVAKFAVDRGIARENPIRVQTGRGVLAIRWTLGEDGTVAHAAVEMGEPILAAGQIPVRIPGVHADDRVIAHAIPRELLMSVGPAGWLDAAGCETAMTCVSMGNPHAVIFCRDVARVPLALVGTVLERAAFFPNRINVHFVQVVAPDEVIMRTWERGSGVTRACGTGASAVCVAGVLAGKTAPSIHAHLPGGDLHLQWDGDGRQVIMTGPATEVFEGVFAPSFLAAPADIEAVRG